ncbi:hypothetical protein [Bradyrhizobium sp. MOS002]|uniref:hypothetical protein n=1 Tax=Bradyrhizobium sp. MOS002 TaxID=2133947 RepID=UPI000D11EEDD|nr:hypothetical protein [Bradyrhizobium sp. MOS002]PSO25948.1 hypothetical protein C7G41_28600 [Bradyrhizobium sp. MOS002]
MSNNGNGVARICASVGFEIVDIASAVRAGQTAARVSLQRIHAELVGTSVTILRVFVETENTEAKIDAFTLWAFTT